MRERSKGGVHDAGVPDAIPANVYPRFPNSERATSAGRSFQSTRERLVYLFVHRDLACAWTQLTTDMAALCSPG
jgi:hypothetical protein